ncbi:aminopeptidase P family protein [Rhizobium tropici]|uniref:Aminopeptidase P family protein n=1 Tax=Rhizobium tropici TaxID=398 RepID=A0A5B0W9M2_RHITR|nr:Xaa-Pro peptidase family protein [Rhizobium tropici]KAA1183075.1 aminopeptidase P family protein [Rhizobium tropici]
MTDARGYEPFDQAEFDHRIERARRAMEENKLDAIVVSSEANLEYLSGMVTQFAWVTPTRPFFFVVPRDGEPTAVIPGIGYTNWQDTSWCQNIITWPSPRPGDEGISILKALFASLRRKHGRIGFEIGPESRIGMPVADLWRLKSEIDFEIADCQMLMANLRVIKSPAEIARIRLMCGIAGRAFAELPRTARIGDSERKIHREFIASLILNGADAVPYLAIGSGRGGYTSIIMGPTDRVLARGDVLILDTGSKVGGYYCDYDRNFAFGNPSDQVVRVHEALWLATEAGIAAARPGKTAADLFYAQANVLSSHGHKVGNVGRFGHGLGKIVTEFPSNAPGDRTFLRPGMVFTIEPSVDYDGKIMAHEENIVITEDGAELLSPRAPREIPVIGA